MTEKKSIAIVYHEADLDGVMSAAIASNYFHGNGDKINLLPYNYGKSIPDIEEGVDEVLILDVSFGDRTAVLLKDWMDRGIKVVWLDHHQTAIDAVSVYNWVIPGIRKVGTAACELTWKYIYGDDSVPPSLIKYLGAYDVWDKERFDWDNTMAIQYWARCEIGLRVNSALNVLMRDIANPRIAEKVKTNDRISIGKAILRFLGEKNKGEINTMSFTATVRGYKAICMNTLEFNSTTFNSIYDERNYDIMMPFAWTGDFARFSIYTTKKGIDAGKLAKSINPRGGGHAQAGGFQMSAGDFVEFLKTKNID